MRKMKHLSIPLSTGIALVPFGISEADLDFFIENLRLWKPTLVKKAPPLPATLVGEHNGHAPDAGAHI